MDPLKYIELFILFVGAASVGAAGLHGALALVAPKTESAVDDKIQGALGKVVSALEWVKKLLDSLALNFKK